MSFTVSAPPEGYGVVVARRRRLHLPRVSLRNNGIRRPKSRAAVWRRQRLRRLLAAALAALSVWLIVRTLAPPSALPDAVDVVVAARDIAIGQTLTGDDLRVERWPPGHRASSAVRAPPDAVGRQVLTPVAAGEVMTRTRLAGPGVLAGLPDGRRAVSVPLADSGVLPILRTGDHVDVLAPASGEIVAAGVAVVALPPSAGSDDLLLAGTPGASSVIVALTAAEGQSVSRALGGPASGTGFTLAVHPPARNP